MNKLAKRRCVPCEGGVKPLSEAEARKLLPELEQDWMLIDGGHMLARTFNFKNFVETIAFVNKVARVAEQEQHHPDLSISYNILSIELMTHAINGLSENDFILAAKIDEIK
ncbi:MAG TPA: 4a-hydroxytetrahydrobiopterin dehydratase [Candidatus Paceibacterota bacterium]|nr:4a-hydroxytetrahydrobiopterin dehydratase [Candidatus Paceibacterota bacterium]